MSSSRTAALSLTVLALLFVWTAILFFTPVRIWLLPFASESTVSPEGVPARSPDESTLVVPPARHKRAGKARLGNVDLFGELDQLLVARVRDGAGFGLQIHDLETKQVVETLRVPHRGKHQEHLVVLDAGRLPDRVYLVAWNRSQTAVEIEALELRALHGGYRWARRVMSWIGPSLLFVLLILNRHQLGAYLSRSGSAEDVGPLPTGATAATGGRWRRWDWVTAVLVFLACFHVYFRAPVQQILDSKHISVVSHALLTSGSLALPANFVPATRADRIYTLHREGERVYHFFSSAPAVLNVPFVAAYGLAGIRPITPAGEFLGHNELRILRLTAAVVAAWLCAVLFLIARVWLPAGYALASTLVFAFGTQIFSSVSRAFWSHGWACLLLALALLLLVSPQWKRCAGIYVLISTLLCWAYFCRPTMSLAIVGVTLWLLAVRRRLFPPFFVTGALWAAVFLSYSWKTYGTWLPPYFLSSHLESGRLAGGLLVSSYPTGLLGTLLSPGRGLFVYVPLCILVLWVLFRRWSWIPDKPLAMTALGVCFAHWQLVSLFRNWWGGQSFGPRLMSDVIPWLFVLAVLGIVALRRAAAAGDFHWTPVKRVTVALIVAASIFINTRGAVSSEAQRGAGIWNWRYPSFMAGILPRPEWSGESDGDRGPAN
jgi:hypothetical protein